MTPPEYYNYDQARNRGWPWPPTGAHTPNSEPNYGEQQYNELVSRLLTGDGLATLPEPVPMVHGMFNRGSGAWLAGNPGAYKSFFAIDIACAVSLGIRTNGGRNSEQTRVLYMACEGVGGLRKRVAAWEESTGLKSDVIWLPMAVQIGSPQWELLSRLIIEYGIGLLVVDTQARATVGLDESSPIDMGRMVQTLDRLRAETGVTTLLAHHSSAAGKTLRGSTVVDGAADTVVTLTKDPSTGIVTMSNPKQKDIEQFQDEYYRALPTGRSITLIQTEQPKTHKKSSL